MFRHYTEDLRRWLAVMVSFLFVSGTIKPGTKNQEPYSIESWRWHTGIQSSSFHPRWTQSGWTKDFLTASMPPIFFVPTLSFSLLFLQQSINQSINPRSRLLENRHPSCHNQTQHLSFCHYKLTTNRHSTLESASYWPPSFTKRYEVCLSGKNQRSIAFCSSEQSFFSFLCFLYPSVRSSPVHPIPSFLSSFTHTHIHVGGRNFLICTVAFWRGKERKARRTRTNGLSGLQHSLSRTELGKDEGREWEK